MKRLLFLPVLLAVSGILAFACEGSAQALRARIQVSLEEAYNPNPQNRDLFLPMPCGLQMVFLPVDIPVAGYLEDIDFAMGSDGGGRPGMEYYDQPFTGTVSGPFSEADLPEAWRKNLPKGQAGSHYYFMAKYELSVLQWKAVMDGQCPEEITQDDILPKTEISWHDALDFARRYNGWLLEHAKNTLPRFENDDKNIGYLRLPTEAEWEYAARGGSRNTGDMEKHDFFTLAPGTSLEDHAVFRSGNGTRILDRPQRIGSRMPNPLGLYDTAGNVAEMILEPFRFSLGARLHGSAGGLIRKGGSFASSREEVLPGRRDEVPLFHERGETRTRDMGMRLVLSGINTPGGNRTEKLGAEWAQREANDRLLLREADLLQEIDRVVPLTLDPVARENLETVRNVLGNFKVALENEQDFATDSLIRASVYMLETMRNNALRLRLSLERVFALQEESRIAGSTGSEMLEARQKLIEHYEEVATSGREAIQNSLAFYKTHLINLVLVSDEAFARHTEQIKREFSGNDLFSRAMTGHLVTLGEHRRLAVTGELRALTEEKLQNDILIHTYPEQVQ